MKPVFQVKHSDCDSACAVAHLTPEIMRWFRSSGSQIEFNTRKLIASIENIV